MAKKVQVEEKTKWGDYVKFGLGAIVGYTTAHSPYVKISETTNYIARPYIHNTLSFVYNNSTLEQYLGPVLDNTAGELVAILMALGFGAIWLKTHKATKTAVKGAKKTFPLFFPLGP